MTMEYLVTRLGLILLGFALMTGLFQFVKFLARKVVIFEYQTALLYANGQFKRILGPGLHYISPLLGHTVELLDTRRNLLSVPGQEVLTADRLNLKFSVNCVYEISDPCKAIHTVSSYRDALYSEVQMALRDAASSRNAEDILDSRAAIAEELLGKVKTAGESFGLKVLQVELRDIMFPGELKRMFAETIRAQKESQAALERARGETAALRSLANAARLMEGNPTLYNLRVLLAMEKNNGTVVLGQPGLLPLEKTSPSKPSVVPEEHSEPGD